MNLEQLLQRISQSGPEELDDIAQALTDRYKSLFPDHDVIYLALPKNDPKERKRLLQMTQNLL